MARLAAPVMAALLVFAGVAVVPAATGAGDQRADASPETPTQTSESAARMVLDSPARTGHGTVGPSLSVAVSDGSRSLQNDHDLRSLEKRFEALGSRDAKVNLVLSELVDIKRDAKGLVSEHQAVTRKYANGSLSERELLHRLAGIHQAAVRLERRNAVLEKLIAQLGIGYLDPDLQTVTGLVESLRGPVSARVVDALAAREPIPPVHVEATEQAVVLSMVDDGRYVREGVFFDNLHFGGEANLTSYPEAASRASQLYPWASENIIGTGVNAGPRVEMYKIGIPHRQGKLTSFLDVQTGDVVAEFQQLRLSRLPTTPARTAEETGIRVVLNRTYRGGPMRVDVYDAETGELVTAQVELGNRTLGQTGPDGGVWFVEPRDSYTVRVKRPGGSVTLTVPASY